MSKGAKGTQQYRWRISFNLRIAGELLSLDHPYTSTKLHRTVVFWTYKFQQKNKDVEVSFIYDKYDTRDLKFFLVYKHAPMNKTI